MMVRACVSESEHAHCMLAGSGRAGYFRARTERERERESERARERPTHLLEELQRHRVPTRRAVAVDGERDRLLGNHPLSELGKVLWVAQLLFCGRGRHVEIPAGGGERAMSGRPGRGAR
jgi:hypothetical protein